MKSVVALLVCVLVAGAMAGDLLFGSYGGLGSLGVYGKGIFGGYGYPYGYGGYGYGAYGYPYGGVYGKGYGYGYPYGGYGYGVPIKG
ncbi:prisilkin-39-like [Pomacea canaliculata]|nr:prisilkin-39-like [Pomacea canaliculata]